MTTHLPAGAPGAISPLTPPCAGRINVSLVISANAQQTLARALVHLVDLVDEVLVAADRRAGFAAACGDCVVMVDDARGLDRATIERFIAAMRSGCDPCGE